MKYYEEEKSSVKSWKEWGSILQWEHEKVIEDYNKLSEKYDKIEERLRKLENFRSAVIAISTLLLGILAVIEISIKVF